MKRGRTWVFGALGLVVAGAALWFFVGRVPIEQSILRDLEARFGLSQAELAGADPSRLKQWARWMSKPKHTLAAEALKWRALALKDEFGDIPRDGFIRAAEEMRQMAAPRAPEDWVWLGPGNIGGRVRAILIDPDDPTIMLAGSVSGGIWRSDDSGASWAPVDDFMANLAVVTLARDPNDADVVYAGTGEGFYNIDSIRGAGIFKSVDRGVTWNQLPATANSDFDYVLRVATHPSNSNVLLAATRSGLWRSGDAGVSFNLVDSNTDVRDVDFDPTDGAKVVATGGTPWGGGFGMYSLDHGMTWNSATGLPADGRVEVSYAPSDSSIVYASADANSGEIFKSTDGGQSYTRVNTGNDYLGGQGWYDNVIWVDPTDSDVVVVGGIDLWRSTNGGSSLTRMSTWSSAPNSAHADHHAIVAHPDFDGVSNKTVFFGNDGGIYRATDVYTVQGTSGWTELNNNLGITQFYGAAGNASSGVIVGGTQDNGTLRYTGGTETWDEMRGGDGGFCAADPTDPDYFYGEYVYLQIHRSTNGGASATYIDGGIDDAGSGSTANFIAPFILDPNDENTMLAGGVSLWRSTNVKASSPSWSAIKPAAGKISAIAVAPGDSDEIWVGHNDGQVYHTANGTVTTPTWQRFDETSPHLPDRYCTRITVDPNDAQTVFACFGGFSADNVWASANGGSSWTDITGSGPTGLPTAPVRSLVVDPNDSSHLFVGTEIGVFESRNVGASWQQNGPANVSVDELFWLDSGTLVAATHGRGLYRVEVGPCTFDHLIDDLPQWPSPWNVLDFIANFCLAAK